MKPYKFNPYLKSTLWGGDRIAPFKGLSTTQENVGESWEISSVPGHESVAAERGIAGDPDVGKTLGELIGEYREALVGPRTYAEYGTTFPLLVKFIDARQNLSVQVHPGDELAKERHNSRGKTEMWYVIKADAGAKIYAGLREPLTPEGYEAMMATEEGGRRIEAAIATHDSHDGDVFFLPAGRLHAIGAGNFLAEIQQTSDVTYRVYDFGRKDANGKPRELHVAQAKDAIDYRVWPEYRTDYDRANPTCELVSCPYFKVSRIAVEGRATVDFKTDSFVVAVCMAGAATVNGVAVRQGETLLVPASANVLDVVGTANFLTAVM